MRTRTELLIAAGAASLLIAVAFARGLADRGNVNLDPRSSTFVQSRSGWSAVAAIAEATGHKVVRSRGRSPIRESQGVPGTLLITANAGLSAAYARDLLQARVDGSSVGLLIAGPAAGNVFRCLGYDLDVRILASIRVEGAGASPILLRAAIAAGSDTSRILSKGGFDDEIPCPPVAIVHTDTLVSATNGSAVVLSLQREDGGNIYLLSDATFLSNGSIKESSASLGFLEALLNKYDRLVFDEFHQGFGPGGSLLAATLNWSRRSPWGWALWQIAVVGLLIFVSGAIRFGPIREAIKRQRRSPMEHVKALATALSASEGHDVAIGAMVRGLQRRLTVAGQSAVPASADWRTWVRALPDRMTTPNAQRAAQQLVPFTEPNQPVAAVQLAAHAVEDVWHALHP